MDISRSFPLMLITITLIQQPTGSTNCISNQAEWEASLQPYPGLKEYIEGLTAWQVSDSGHLVNASRSLVQFNWQDNTFQLICPLPDVIEWKYHDRTGNESNPDFTKAYRQSRSKVLSHSIGKHDKRSDYFRSYSCKSSSCCWHHFNVITKPYVKTSVAIQVYEGGDVEFNCTSDWRKEESTATPVAHNSKLRISWKFPSPEVPINYEIINRTTSDTLGDLISTIRIKNATSLNAGVHECIVTDRFNVSSTPSYPIRASSDSRFSGNAHVHVRPLSYIWNALYAMLGMAVLLPLMIKFLPTNEKEADLEEDDAPGLNSSQVKIGNGGGGSDVNLLLGSTGSVLNTNSKPGDLKLLHRKEE